MRTAPLRPARPPATHPRVTICGRWSQTAMDAAPLSSPLASVHGRRGPTHPPSTALPCVHGSVLDLPPLRSRPTLLQFRLPSLGPARTTAGRRAPPSPPVPGTPQSQPPATALPRQNQGRTKNVGHQGSIPVANSGIMPPWDSRPADRPPRLCCIVCGIHGAFTDPFPYIPTAGW